MDAPKRLSRSSSSAAYKNRRSTGVRAPKVTLEKVIGLTANTNSQIALDPNSGTVAYAAGCVAVLLGKQFQENIINTSRKAITALAFSPDGRYLATGESGHAPAVRVFEVASGLQVSEFAGHKFGVTCVAFSPNSKYLVSIGTQHDMITNVWNWRHGIKVASNKISSKVNGLAFTCDGTTFITIGIRHVKFWFLDESKRKTTIQSKNETVPLLGRNGLLGDQKTNVFVDVACGKGVMCNSIYVISQNGTLCQLIDRQITRTVELKTIRAYCVQATETLLIVGCANGIIRVFDAQTLCYMHTLHRPHPLGVDVVTNTVGVAGPADNCRYPDTLGIAFNELDMTLTVVYSDHSLYKWDISRLPKIGRISAALYHSSCVWSIDVLPPHNALPIDTFITCSTDDTIRFWNLHPSSFTDVHHKKPCFNYELLNIIYTDASLGSICEQEYNADKPDIYESRNGVKCICTSPDGGHLASGDLIGNIRVHDICTMSELHLIEAHDAGVLCLEYSEFATGSKYLVSASRDRLIHIFDVDNEYGLLQTLSDHSSTICSVKLISTMEGTLMISCGNDKSVLFRLAPTDQDELNFQLKQNLMSKATPNDMIVDSTKRCAITACQDRMIRLYNTHTAKQKRNYKGSHSDDGYLVKLAIDNTGTYLAVSCSDKSIALIDFETGEIIVTLVGHSELITGLRFTNDCSHLISVSGDGCMFFWRLDDRLIERMFTATALKRSNSEIIHNPKPDVTLVNPPQSSKQVLKPGKSVGNLANHVDFDETFVVKQANNHSVLPAWAKETSMSNGRGKWDTDRATPVMTTMKNGQLQMSPDSVHLANGSSNIIAIAVQSQVTSVPGNEENDTDEEEDAEIFTGHYLPKHSTTQLKLSLNNNVDSYKDLSTPDSMYYPSSLDGEDNFTITHRAYRLEDEKSSTSDAMSHHTAESEDDGLSTPRSMSTSTPASSIPSTPISPNSQLLDIYQQITANQSNIGYSKSITSKQLALYYQNTVPSSTPVSPGAAQSPRTLGTFMRVQESPEESKSASSTKQSSHPQGMSRKDVSKVLVNTLPQTDGTQQQQFSRGYTGGRERKGSGMYRDYSSTESLTSTEELLPGTANSTLTAVSLTESSQLQPLPEEDLVVKDDSFSEIDKLCTALRANLATAQKLLTQVQTKDNSEKDYLVETLRDVCDGFHQMLPPTPQFEAIVHQTVHQFLLMNKNQNILDLMKNGDEPSEKG